MTTIAVANAAAYCATSAIGPNAKSGEGPLYRRDRRESGRDSDIVKPTRMTRTFPSFASQLPSDDANEDR